VNWRYKPERDDVEEAVDGGICRKLKVQDRNSWRSKVCWEKQRFLLARYIYRPLARSQLIATSHRREHDDMAPPAVTWLVFIGLTLLPRWQEKGDTATKYYRNGARLVCDGGYDAAPLEFCLWSRATKVAS
jgi:hypothetical protein